MICLMENGRRRLTAAGWDGSAPSAAAAGKHHLSLEPVHPVPSTMDSTKPLFDQWVRERERKKYLHVCHLIFHWVRVVSFYYYYYYY